jgi:ABC-type phosphate/phosphonate transport system substrate-binding protein
MYNASPPVSGLWARLIGEAGRLARVPLEIIAHPFPNDIEDLWNRPDLGLGFICGRAFMLAGARHIPIAVPLRSGVAADGPYTDAPLYHTELLVAESSPFTRLEDAFGRRLGWTVRHSHSGYGAVREHLARFARPGGAPLFSREIGPLHTPAKCLEALRNKEADVVPLDAYYRDLLLRNSPDVLADTRSVGKTRSCPMPLLVAAPGADPALCRALRKGLLAACRRADMADVLRGLCITGFAQPDAAAYRELIDTTNPAGRMRELPPAAG